MRRGIVAVNPAKLVEVAPEKAPKKLVWTPERVAEWAADRHSDPRRDHGLDTGTTGIFLDHLIAYGDPPDALYYIVAHRGLRRGEACGLHGVAPRRDDGLAPATYQRREVLDVRHGGRAYPAHV